MHESTMIAVAEREIGGELIQTASARDLHAYLEVGRDFSTWIKERIKQYDFIPGRDFIAFEAAPQKGGAGNRGLRVEYSITTGMAKELSMVENNEKGKQARSYFIECERRAKAPTFDPSNPVAVRSLLLDYTERLIAAETALQEQAPKVQFHDAVAEATNCQTIEEVAKILGIGERRLFALMRSNGLLTKSNLPYQKHIDAGYFRVREGQFTDGRGVSRTWARTMVTGRGFPYIHERLKPKLISLARCA